MNIVRRLNIEYNLDTCKIDINNKASFYNTDANVAMIYVKLTYHNKEGSLGYVRDIENHSLILNMKNQNNKKLSLGGEVITDKNRGKVFVFKLPKSFTEVVGTCSCRLIDTFIENKLEKIATSDAFTYTVKENDVENDNGSGSEGGATGTTSVTYDTDNELLVFNTVKTSDEITS